MPASSSSTFHLSSQLNRRSSSSSSSSSSSRGGEEWCSAGETIMRPQEEYPTKKAVSNGSRKKKEKEKGVRYRECRKNHAANIGGYAVDGCREFMASGEEGTSAALRCAACSCHRNFHKREVENDAVCDCSSISTSRS